MLLQIPVRTNVKEFMLANYGAEPLVLKEGNMYFHVLNREYEMKYDKPESYIDTLTVEIEDRWLPLSSSQMVLFNNFVLQQIHHIVIFSRMSNPAGKKTDIVLDVISNFNLDISFYENSKAFNRRLQNKAINA